uniref:Pept_C1 domain-containing protein n=1 Tax=Caenorhabditis tropicalis TaxID=1561998 RepID=A0A1I7UE38_9PELO
MQFFLIFLFHASWAFVVPGKPAQLTGKALVEHINSVQSSWTAEYNDISNEEMRFKGMDARFIKPQEDDPILDDIKTELLPASFDARDRWPACRSIRMIRDQTWCASCWAFGAAEVISDRICIQSNATQQPIISPEDILSCCGSSCGYGCKGGFPLQAFKFWMSKGAVTGGDYQGEGCMPYSIAPCQKGCVAASTPSCKTTCQKSYTTAVYKKDKHFGSSAYRLPSGSVSAIQSEIYKNGPVVAAIEAYVDFHKYKSGVYHHVSGDFVTGHAVKIIGWGTERGEDYWLIANSWGTIFGENGFGKIRRGTNECKIEENVVAGLVKNTNTNSFFLGILIALAIYLF